MKHQVLLSNYQDDLVKSRNTPTLIELNKKEMTEIAQINEQQLTNVPFLLARRIYDANTIRNSTNVIVLDGDSWEQKERFALLETLLNLLQDEIKVLKNIEVGKNLATWALSATTGGALNKLIGPYLDKGVDFLFDELGVHFSKLFIDNAFEKIDLTNTLISSAEGLLHDSSADFLAAQSDKVIKRRLSLSAIAQKELEELSKNFANSGKHDVFQLAFKIILATCIESPKIIYVNNPHKLDDNSLAIISILLSYAKHYKDEQNHLGISFVYAYSDYTFQPYCDVEEKYKGKKLLLDDQRRFAQRYGMLERPNSDVPTIAVKSSLFVGRTDELVQLEHHFKQREVFTITAVSGEPGIGKTALINKHIDQISTKRMIVLTMLNEAGHNSTNTGLSSLEKSILEEASRLELTKTYIEKGLGSLNKMTIGKSVVDIIGKIFDGADKAINTGLAIKERAVVEKAISNTKEQGIGDLDNKQAGSKQMQFDKLDNAIDELNKLSEPHQPLILFIDDIQWIDNNSSEYILTRLANKKSLYIVTSVRPSDAAAMFRIHKKNTAYHEYSLSILKAIGIQGHETIAYADAIKEPTLSTVKLSGFDRKHLHELITVTIKGSPTQLNELTDSIFSEISYEGEDTVNSLFAIESINMLCDERFYSQNISERLILTGPIRFSNLIIDVSAAIKETFCALRSKYEHSLSHSLSSKGKNSFNLMAYAVLEERLHLLKLNFAEYGNMAVNTLLFSSLLGEPFSSTLVKEILNGLLITDKPQLQPIKKYLTKGEQQTELEEEHYEIMNEVYEILKRHTIYDDKYHYRHVLLNIFLDKQLDYLLETIPSDDIKLSTNSLFDFIVTVIRNQHCNEHFYQKKMIELDSSQIAEKLFYKKAELQVLKKAFIFDPEFWVLDYTNSLRRLVGEYHDTNQFDKAIALCEQSFEICRVQYEQDPEKWAVYYMCIIDLLGGWYQQDNGLSWYEYALSICQKHYEQDPDEWAQIYTNNLINLVTASFRKNSEFKKNTLMPLIKQWLSTCEIKCRHPIESKTWARLYIQTLNVQSVVYTRLGLDDNALELKEHVVTISYERYILDPEIWIDLYTQNVKDLMRSYKVRKQIDKAITLGKQWLSVCEIEYSRDSGTFIDQYVKSIDNLVDLYKCNKQIDQAVVLQEQWLDACEADYNLKPDSNAERYISSLTKLVDTYIHDNQIDKALALQEQWLASCEADYKLKPNLGAERYIISLTNLADTCIHGNKFDKAIVLLEKSLVIFEDTYKLECDHWIDWYADTVKNLTELYFCNNQTDMAREIEYQLFAMFEANFKQDPEEWIFKYLEISEQFETVNRTYNQLNRAIELDKFTLELNERWLSICEEKVIHNPEAWMRNYRLILKKLAYIYKCKNELDKAIILEEQLLTIYQQLAQKAPRAWSASYVSSLRNLAATYKLNNNTAKAMALEEQLLAACDD
ncbi:TPA: AAA family ATPase [Vibrio parahaemolyticus]